jgi:serine-type D-Ala-D-Ala endopeptidase (penicillin-binding protein 7)
MLKNKKIFSIFIIAISIAIVAGLAVTARYVFADDEQTVVDNNQHFSETITAEIAKKGKTVSAFTDSIKLVFTPDLLSSSSEVELIKFNENLPLPWELDKVSDIYQFDIKNKDVFNKKKALEIQIAYDKQNKDFKQIFYFDNNCACWRPLPTKDNSSKGIVSATTTLTFARVAVFSMSKVIIQGSASWYKYKSGDFAASPDFPKGSKIKVINTKNNKSVVVTINDYGPDRLKHPDRVLDLEKVAFKKIAALGAGTINIRIEPLYIAPGSLYNNVGNLAKRYYSEPQFSVKSAVALNEKTGDIIWEKHSASSSPLASLTKIVAIKTFLDTKPTLSTVVAYSIKDEQYNYEYCQPWESAKLKIADGETLTIGDLVYTSLVGSTNNTIETLVRVSGLTRDKFIEQMNINAQDWGASSTHFVEPTGLSPDNVSSPLDYAIITKEVLNNPIVQKTDTMSEYKFTTINKKVSHRIKNTNQFIELNRYKITGSKTGYLNEAGYCLMTRVEDGKNSIIVVTFGASTRAQSFQDTYDLINYSSRKLNDKIL